LHFFCEIIFIFSKDDICIGVVFLLYEKKNKSLVGLSFELKWSQLQPTTSLLHDYAHVKGALEFINTWEIQYLSNMGLETCVSIEIISASAL